MVKVIFLIGTFHSYITYKMCQVGLLMTLDVMANNVHHFYDRKLGLNIVYGWQYLYYFCYQIPMIYLLILALPCLRSFLRHVLNHLFRKFRHPNLQNKIESLFPNKRRFDF